MKLHLKPVLFKCQLYIQSWLYPAFFFLRQIIQITINNKNFQSQSSLCLIRTHTTTDRLDNVGFSLSISSLTMIHKAPFFWEAGGRNYFLASVQTCSLPTCPGSSGLLQLLREDHTLKDSPGKGSPGKIWILIYQGLFIQTEITVERLSRGKHHLSSSWEGGNFSDFSSHPLMPWSRPSYSLWAFLYHLSLIKIKTHNSWVRCYQ